MVDGVALAAVIISALAIVATVVLAIVTDRVQRRDRARSERLAAQDRQRVEDLAARVRQEKQQDSQAVRQERRLQALEVRYAEVAAPAMAQLDAIKMLHPDGELWPALQFVPHVGSTALGQQQLRAAQMDLLLAEQRARNVVKGFWDDTLRAMEQHQLPPAFGAAGPDHISFGFSRWVYRANNFRELAEPFDIANYYRLELDRSEGHYLRGGNRVHTYMRLESMWRQHCAGCNPPPATFKSSVAWAEAMLRARNAPKPAPAADTPVERLKPPTLPPAGTLPLVHRAL